MLSEISFEFLVLKTSGYYVDSPGFIASGAASDSLFTVLLISGIVTVMAFVLGLVLDSKSESPEHGLARRKPLLIPSIAFTISAILVISVVPIPMSQYRGLNESRFTLHEEYSIPFTVHDGDAYSHALTFRAITYLETDESVVVYLRVYQNDALVESAALSLPSPLIDEMVSDELTIPIQPGVFIANYSYLDMGSLPSGGNDRWIDVTLSQPLAPGFLPELLAWDAYRFVLIMTSFFLILGGICVGKEERKRRSLDPVDQEPPREGEIYVRKWG